jgi:hypothetical protein
LVEQTSVEVAVRLEDGRSEEAEWSETIGY